jgi:hypothetical protein
MSFLCKDILKILINEKCSGKTGLACELVCKRFKGCVDREIVVKKYMYEKIYEQNRETIERIEKKKCPKCNIVLDDIKKMKKHLEKHILQTKRGQGMQINTLPPPCTYCNVPYIGKDSRHVRYCPMRRENCRTITNMYIYPFVESLCCKPEGIFKK